MSTDKEKLWLQEYFACGMNATEAARRAGYKHPLVQGAQKKAKFVAEIKQRLEESAMSGEEVLQRLADQARVDLGPYLNDYGYLDWKRLRDDGKTHLVKKYEIEHLNDGRFKVKVEAYDGQAALVHLGRHHKLFTDKVEREHVWRIEIVELIRQGKVSVDEVQDELGPDLAKELFESIGVSAITSREAEA